MAADLVARLYLQSQGFDRSIEESTKKVRKFQKETDSAGKGVKTFTGGLDMSIPGLGKMVSGVGKLAGAFGLTVGAMEVFDKAINSNATLQRQYNSYMEAGSTVVDQFFSAIYNGDWSVFNDGIDNAISKAKNFASTYRNLQDLMASNQLRFDRQDARKDQLESIIEDESKPLAERKKAQAELDRMLLMMIADIRQASEKTTESLYSLFEGLAGGGNWQQYGNPRQLVEELINPYSGLRSRLSTYRDIRDTKNQVVNPNAFKYSANDWIKINNEASEKFYKNYSAAERERNDQLLRLVDSLNEKTMPQFEDLLGKLSQLESYAGMLSKDRFGAREEIQDTEAKSIEKKMADVTKSGVEKGMQQVDVSKIPTPTIAGVTTNGRTVGADIESGYIKAPEIKAATAANYEYASSLEGIASIMGSITNLTSEGAGAWISYATNVMTAAAQAIPAIKAITNAQAQQAVTGAAASAAAIPVVGWITAAAAVASVIAAMTSVPKFAGGGIVPGSSFYGDHVPALVNSGEMILNRSQQSNLFSMLQGTGRRSSEVIVSGELIARGRDLVAVINKQDRFNQRVR